MAGGHVKAIPYIITGHKARPGNRQPYNCFCFEIAHNEMAIAYICMPEKYEVLNTVWQSLYSADPAIYNIARQLLDSHEEELIKLREDFQSKKVLEHKDLDLFNKHFQKTINFSAAKLKEKHKGTYTKFNSNEKIRFTMG